MVELLMLAAAVTVAGNDGAAIQRAIDEAAASGGGRVSVPAGVYRSGSLRMRSGVDLHLEKGAVIRGGTRSEDYFEFPDEVTRVKPENSSRVFIYAWDAEDIAITGEGLIDGRGKEFFDRFAPGGRFWPKPAHPRPRMVQFVRCRNVRLEGVTFEDSPGWTMLIRKCEDVVVDGIFVNADQRIINSDGIDFDGCRRVKVRRSRFLTGDDCLILRAMREPGSDERIVCEDVEVEDCDLDSTCQAVRMGCPSDDTIRHVRFRNIRARGLNGINFDYPVRYLRPTDEGYMDISDVVFDGFRGEFMNMALRMVVAPGVKLRNVSDITFRNFRVKSMNPVEFIGNFDSPLKGITLEKCAVDVPGQTPFVAKATEPLRFRSCVFNGKPVPDDDLVTPRGERQPLVRKPGVSWESAGRKL